MRNPTATYLPKRFWILSSLLVGWITLPIGLFLLAMREFSPWAVYDLLLGFAVVLLAFNRRALTWLSQRRVRRGHAWYAWFVMLFVGAINVLGAVQPGPLFSPETIFLWVHSLGIVLLSGLVAWQLLRVVAKPAG